MKDLLFQLINKKKIVILGFGREGMSTYLVIRKYFPEYQLAIADKDENIIEKYEHLKKDKYLNYILGVEYLSCLNQFDLIIKTPGISLKDLNYFVEKEKITSQTDIFLKLYAKQIIGITGTKGKSTTSSLIFKIIHFYSKNSLLVGNIGVPPFDMLDEINENTTIVFEMSSHQLEYITKSPHIAILLNLYQEHLDHYRSYKDYQLSKFNIAKNQNEEDIFIFHYEDVLIASLIKELKIKPQMLPYSLNCKLDNGAYTSDGIVHLLINGKESFFYEIHKEISLKGTHNLLNIMAAIVACKLKGIPDEFIKKGIIDFKGLEHRIEFIGKFNEIFYYNDSIATIPEATIEAIKALNTVNTIILGGYDRGIEYSEFAAYLVNSKIEHFIFIDDAGLRIFSELKKLNDKSLKEYYVVNSLEEAVDISKLKTRKNTICLLSPAAASYGRFKNFEERGNLFKQLVQNENTKKAN